MGKDYQPNSRNFHINRPMANDARDLYCHNCGELVRIRPGRATCSQCAGFQLEEVADTTALQRRNADYISPPNVTEPPRPLILVRNQVVSREQLQQQHQQRLRNRQLDLSKMNKQVATSKLSSQTDCSICLVPFKFSDKIPITSAKEPCEISRLLCGHIFHYDCAKSWFQSAAKNECPFCRRQALDQRSYSVILLQTFLLFICFIHHI